MNAFDPTPAPELLFPRPPFRIDGRFVDVTPADISNYLEAILSWRLGVLEFLKTADGKYVDKSRHLSAHAQRILIGFLAPSWTPEMSRYAAQSPYNLRPFPQDAIDRNGDSRIEWILGVLRWRAAVMDYLDDAPDAIVLAIELLESIAIEQFLNPVDHKELCWLCLTEFEQKQIHPDCHDCVLLSHIRAKWPPMPSAFRSWAAEARGKSQ